MRKKTRREDTRITEKCGSNRERERKKYKGLEGEAKWETQSVS